MIGIQEEKLIEEVFQELERLDSMVLATCSDNRVTARTVSIVVLEDTICFQTDSTFLKYNQICENPNVALCMNHIQIEGVAQNLGHPFDPENAAFMAKFKQRHAESVEQYSDLKTEIVIQVKPTFITVWKYREGQPLREFLDLESHIATREWYDIGAERRK